MSNFVGAIAMTSFDTAGLLITFLPINPLGTTEPCSIIKITNNSNVDVIVSYDGVGDHEFVPKGKEVLLNFQANAQPPSDLCLLRDGRVVYVRGAAAGAGLVYLSGYFQANQ